MPKPIFQNFTIAVTGDFGANRSPEQMRSWIQNQGGTFAYEISPKVTHLICSKDHFKKSLKPVQQARKLKSVKIVSFDWLEDSLLKKSAKREGEYLMNNRTKSTAQKKEKKKMVRKANVKKSMVVFEKSCKEFEADLHAHGYGIYHDSTTFAYDITLARANLSTNKNERYSLRLYESHATPKYYAVYVKYSAPGAMAKGELLAPVASTWELAWSAFENFFKCKTSKAWDQRLVKGSITKVEEGKVNEIPFIYAPPKEGLPRGVFLEV